MYKPFFTLYCLPVMSKYLFKKHVSNFLEMFNESDKRWLLLSGRHQETSLYKITTKSLRYYHVSKMFDISNKAKIRLIKKNFKGTYDLSSMNLCNPDILLSSSNTSIQFIHFTPFTVQRQFLGLGNNNNQDTIEGILGRCKLIENRGFLFCRRGK